MNSKNRMLIAFALLSAGLAGCAARAPQVGRTTAPIPSTDVAVGGPVCVSIQRGGSGNAADTRIAERWPETNYGAQNVACTGKVGGSSRQILLDFDLGSLPESAVVTRATVTLHRALGGGVSLKAYRVTAPWDERTVTWQSFQNSFDPTPEAIVQDDGSDETPGAVSFDVTPLVHAWIAGEQPRHGVLLRQDASSTAFVTSEAEALRDRPRLDVCYEIAPAG